MVTKPSARPIDVLPPAGPGDAVANEDLVLTADFPDYPAGTVMKWDVESEVYRSPDLRLKITRDFVADRPEAVRLSDLTRGVTYYRVSIGGAVTPFVVHTATDITSSTFATQAEADRAAAEITEVLGKGR